MVVVSRCPRNMLIAVKMLMMGHASATPGAGCVAMNGPEIMHLHYLAAMNAHLSLAALIVSGCAHPSTCPVAATPVAPTSPTAAVVGPVTPTPALVGPMAKLAFMRGVWRGPASGVSPDRSHYEVTQTERMGPMLGGDVIVIEGRGYKADGSTGFNAFAVVSYDPATQKYAMASHAQGQAGVFELKPTNTGYTWDIPAGPGATIHYEATVTSTTWHEVGAYTADGKPPVPMFEMNLTKVGDTDWPLATPIAPK